MGYRNKNRGYQELIVWQDAIDLFRLTTDTADGFDYALRRTLSQQIACADSVHRNIAEGWCRRSLGEYLYFLNVALASLGEYVSGLEAFRSARVLAADRIEPLDALAYKIENGLLKLVESIREKARRPDETAGSRLREPPVPYGGDDEFEQSPSNPTPQQPTSCL